MGLTLFWFTQKYRAQRESFLAIYCLMHCFQISKSFLINQAVYITARISLFSGRIDGYSCKLIRGAWEAREKNQKLKIYGQNDTPTCLSYRMVQNFMDVFTRHLLGIVLRSLAPFLPFTNYQAFCYGNFLVWDEYCQFLDDYGRLSPHRDREGIWETVVMYATK